MAKSNNSNLHKAKREANDEFYTQLSDIENEIFKYKDHFKGKVVFCNCDDPNWSNFFKYFANNFVPLGLKKLVTTHYEKGGQSYKLEINGDFNGDGKVDDDDQEQTLLSGDGDFRSQECIDILKKADIVVSNPPFSLFREYMSLLVEHDKKFLIVGSKNAITYKDVFSLIKDNKLWLGVTSPKNFIQPDGTIKTFGNIGWFTNLEHSKRNEELILYKEYNEVDYPKYDNYDAINVDKVNDIPVNYEGYMGVPITFLDKFNPRQFKIIGQMATTKITEFNYGYPYLNGDKIYARIIVKRNK